MTQHTPGPWEVWDRYRIVTSHKPPRTIAEIVGREGDEANASMIAAAPDMLNALEVLANTAESRGIPVDAARAAIAKAKGGAA